MTTSIGARHGARRSLAALALACAASALPAALPAQRQQLARGIDREIAFVRALAREMRFIELARLEVQRLAAEYRSGRDQDKIAQLAVEISYYGATSRTDRAQRRTLFKETIDRCQELIERSSDAGVQLEARRTLANASHEFGQFLIEERDSAREQAPERTGELEAEATAVLRAGIDACEKVMAALQRQRGQPELEVEAWLIGMKRAVLEREQARVDRENRSVLCARAIRHLEEVVFDAGEETAIGQRGLFELAQCKEVDGRIAEAIASYRDMVGQIAASLQDAGDGRLQLSGELRGFLFDMLQEVYVRAAELMLRDGAAATAELFAAFRADVARFGPRSTDGRAADVLDATSPHHGHLMLLLECRLAAESGDAERMRGALALAARIHERHPGDQVGARAKAVLRDMLALQRGPVPPPLLLEIAKGELQGRAFEAAIKVLRRALVEMAASGHGERALEAHQMLGTAYAQTDRQLEAVIALSAGLEKFGATDKDRAGDVADALDRAVSALKRQSRNDPAFEPLFRQAAELMTRTGGSSGSRLSWNQANDAFADKRFADAIGHFARITPDFPLYERARVNIARAWQTAGDFAAARKALDDYRTWARSNPPPADDAGKQHARAQAQALAELVDVMMLFAEARGDQALGLGKDLTRYPAAIEKAQSFLTDFGKDGADNVPLVLSYVGRLYSDLGQLDRAEEAWTQLKTKDVAAAARLATEIFAEYQSQLQLLVEELDQLIAGGRSAAAIDKATADVAAVRARLVAIGTEYIAGSARPQLAVMLATIEAAAQLDDWPRVEQIARKALELWGGHGPSKPLVDRHVRPRIGEALLRQRRFQEAHDTLVAAERATPEAWELKRLLALALGGWFEFDRQGRGRAVPGLERPADAFQKYYGDAAASYRVWALRPEVPQYGLEWYRFHWEAYWFARQAAATDDRFRAFAESLYGTARSTDDFATLKRLGAEGLLLFKYFQGTR